MDHVVYTDYKDKELEKLENGTKTMIIRGAMGRKLPHGRIHVSDTLFFIENKGDGLVKAKASVSSVFFSEKLSPDASRRLINDHQDKLHLDAGLKKRFDGKRYLTLITIKDFEVIVHFRIDKSNYGNMDDWLLVEDINTIKK